MIFILHMGKPRHSTEQRSDSDIIMTLVNPTGTSDLAGHCNERSQYMHLQSLLCMPWFCINGADISQERGFSESQSQQDPDGMIQFDKAFPGVLC